TNDSLEKFYDYLIDYFDNTNQNEIKINVEQTKIDYLEEKEESPEEALRKFFPLPDENPNKRLIHLLPNYNAFTNLIARAQKHVDGLPKDMSFEIIHDEQKQFDIIFQSALEAMKNLNVNDIAQNTFILDSSNF